MVAVVGEVTALLANQLVVDNTESNIWLHVILALRMVLLLGLGLVVSLEIAKIILHCKSIRTLVGIYTVSFSIILRVVLVPFCLLGMFLLWAAI